MKPLEGGREGTEVSAVVEGSLAHRVGSALRRSALHAFWRRLLQERVYRDWLRRGRPVPAPHRFKQLTVIAYARQFDLRVFVETGTYLGDMVEAVRGVFGKIHSIELSAELARHAQKRLAIVRHATVWQGDSGKVLPDILASIDQPCLFWLDAHYSGGATVRGDSDTPILRELLHVAAHRLARSHVILIDDARLFTGDVYPSIRALAEWAARALPHHRLEVQDDMIRLTPGRLGAAGP